MASSIIKYLGGAITMFALCLIGTATAASNGNGDEKKEVKAEKVVLAPQWFQYNGTSQNRNDIENPDNYQPLTAEPLCEDGTELCSVHAEPDSEGKPVLSSAFVDQIMTAISDEEPTPAIKLEN